MPITEPLIKQSHWDKAVSFSRVLSEAVMNPNTDYMTKLLFDSRLFVKKFGKDVPYWSNALFAVKMVLAEQGNKGLTAERLAKETKISARDLSEVLKFLVSMAELEEKKGKYSLNLSNPFSKIFSGRG